MGSSRQNQCQSVTDRGDPWGKPVWGRALVSERMNFSMRETRTLKERLCRYSTMNATVCENNVQKDCHDFAMQPYSNMLEVGEKGEYVTPRAAAILVLHFEVVRERDREETAIGFGDG